MNEFNPTTDIRVIRRPTVYLVGRQVVDQEVIDQFLADHGVAWQTDTEVAGEYLAEIAGRLCYMSYARPRPGGNKVYLDHIKEVGHGSVLEHATWNFIFCGVSRSLTHELVRHRAGMGYCLTGDTLIYSEHTCNGHRQGANKRRLADLYAMTQTHHGRSRLKLLRLRCLDEASGNFTTGRVRSILSSGVKPVYRVELKDGKTITCSKEHRFLTPAGWLPLEQIVGGLELSSHGVAHYGSLDTPIATNGIAAYKDRAWLEEHYHEKGLEQATIAEMVGVSTHTIRAWIRKHRLQKPYGSWTIGREPWNKGRRYHAGWRHTPETRQRLSEQKKGERNPQWRGGITPYALRIRRGVEDLRPAVFQRDQFTCRLCGAKGGSLEIHHILPIWARPDLALEIDNLASVCEACHDKLNGGRELEYAEHFGVPPETVAALKDKKPRTARPRILRTRFVQIRSIVYAGELDTFDIQMEGPNHNFVANGIVTHNSQLSQRYVDESVAEYVEPDCIAEDAELHALWLEAVAHAHQSYIKLVEGLANKFKDEPDRTLRRKLARQAARSVLPNATETKIFVTANARALRHFIEMRASRHAETEIRQLAVEVLRIMQQEAPNLFSDYQLIPLPDGTFEATTAHRKV
jgi:thymidylate synthase ThyX/5-methylcytosine-specific restriction endonuclease McrA/DNA-binding XRE family transcriptional regulator